MVLTEEKLRTLYKKENIKELRVEEDTIVTPSAQEYMSQMSIKLVIGEKIQSGILKEKKSEIEKEIKPIAKYKGVDGGFYFEKPEYMTQIKDNILVKKNNKRIILRGKLDILKSKFILLSNILKTNKKLKLNEDLDSIEKFINKIVISEILESDLEEITLCGENLEDIKKISHNPKKYFKIEHLFDVSSEGSLVMLRLNEVRSLVREVEISAIEAYLDKNDELEREDIVKALNRLSSGIYVMMLKEVKGIYGN
jgi:ethanolamine utilization cobalamin adenosyltransferase